ncbi:MAG: hypothetical protein EWV76_00910 [Microcystis novacekii Mn_MB_F_20050700_S1]|uniref:Uncharacterized protein n=1 Tax=Microcystis novacekii Mn_MB_F_20050700_S1D TaxID=2486266 RepID=A0A552JD61_9CHRO|nr:MAG: hypothetical protein EWV76_00910 [Microcystis novacekii Mn_MB_F_20050700_S1]TRU93444.1 MAG: hypothetical protein EWV54_00900 [Microcystis novacekii Mn_MB_F_20050700_S1D]
MFNLTALRNKNLQLAHKRSHYRPSLCLDVFRLLSFTLINVHGAFPKIDRCSGRTCMRERTLPDLH